MDAFGATRPRSRAEAPKGSRSAFAIGADTITLTRYRARTIPSNFRYLANFPDSKYGAKMNTSEPDGGKETI
ncbi:hypothetical protein NDU88_004698 [Pleurodeles waltl]|uniref:Uncharacterized protein n=1 Tax=Pleurodeles waltl TaxID=8319 RepID=A0AAV7LM83_PLEWA|nr:hypothetical protein NDU88_004698 [Pleurodeles waltl]